jgi:hypothetical protein
MADSADKVIINPKPIRLGLAWGLVATHALSGQQEQIVGFHTETEAKEWLASKGYRAWLRTRGYVKPITTFAMPGKSPTRRWPMPRASNFGKGRPEA